MRRDRPVLYQLPGMAFEYCRLACTAALLAVGCTAPPTIATGPATNPAGSQVTAADEPSPSGGSESVRTAVLRTASSPVDLTAWRTRLASARATQIKRLAGYREAGEFPQNHRFLGYIPVFVDRRGVACAVAYLMQRSGRQRDVEAIVAADNNVYIEDVRNGALHEWVLFSGLTQEEAAYIQPAYPRRMQEMTRMRSERRRLVQHFQQVERTLLANTEASLDVALARLLPRIKAGADLHAVGR